MLGKGNRYIQVKVSAMTYEYLKKYSSMFGCSISNYCSDAVTSRIIASGALTPQNLDKLSKEAAFINATYKE